MRIRPSRLLVGFLLALVPLGAVAAGEATLTFRKVFKSSSPEYVEIKVNEQGAGSYDIRQLDDPPNPQPFQVGPQLTARLFALAAKLHDFRDQHLDVHRRIANLGQKTFRYENGGEAYETSFNYTLNPTASDLLQIFEGLSLQQQDVQTLERTLHYDRLGINDVLIQLEANFDQRLIPEPEKLLPVLDEISADIRVIDIARERARRLATRIRSGA